MFGERLQLTAVAGAAARSRIGPRVMHRVVADQQFVFKVHYQIL